MRAPELPTQATPPIGGTESAHSSSPAWRERLAEAVAFLAPMALVLGLALSGGGFDLATRHVAGLAVWVVVVGLLLFGAASAVKVANPLYWAIGLVGGLALLSALSSLWSGSMELSVIEADRVLVYLGILIASFLITPTRERRQRFVEGLAVALALVALLGLVSRLLPDLLSVTQVAEGGRRLRYPLGYWNANGAIFAMAVVLLLWMSRRATMVALRWASVAAIPVAMLALYLTYSRGGVLALAVGAIALLALSHDRLWMLATFAITLLSSVPAVLAVQARFQLENNLGAQRAVDQGEAVALILLACIGAALLGYAVLWLIERRGGRLTWSAVELSRNRTLLTGIAVVAVALALGALLTVGGRAWDQFSQPDVKLPNQPEKHFTQLSGSGRRDFWRVAFNAFKDRPIVGQGAGTYRFSWDQERSISLPVQDAHSLYIEAYAELGAVGGTLVLAMVATLLSFGFLAWRGALEDDRELCAALLAVMLAFAISAGFDWFWELTGIGAVLFLAAGPLLSARSDQLGDEDELLGMPPSGPHYGLVIVGLGLAWVSAAALVAPLLVDHEIKASQEAAADGNIPSAVDHAESARSIEPWAASPYVQLGLLAELDGDNRTAIVRLTDAIDREDRNWQLYFLRSEIERKAGDDARANADLEKARQLNPRARILRGSP